MCGRYVIVTKVERIAKRFNVATNGLSDFSPNYNVSHGNMAPVICNDSPNQLQLLQFGLTPSWAEKQTYVVNARAEGDHNQSNDVHYRGVMGIAKKPMFRSSIRNKRCLVIADCFFEGPKLEKLNEPYLIYLKDKQRPFAFAGIWDEWIIGDKIVKSFAIITTFANEVTKKIRHHRSPVILSKEMEHLWLDQATPFAEILNMLQPCPSELMNAYPVSNRMKNPKENDRNLLDPVGNRIINETNFFTSQQIKLEGMGNSHARERRRNEKF